MYVVMKIPVNLRFRYTSTVAELFDEPYFMAYSLQIKTMKISVKKIVRIGVTSIEKFKFFFANFTLQNIELGSYFQNKHNFSTPIL